MATFSPAAVTDQLVATEALLQLNRTSIFARAAVGNYESAIAQRGDTITIRRTQLVETEDYDPRSGIPAESREPGYVSSNLMIEKLFTAGFPIFSHDNRMARSRYVTEYGGQIGANISSSVDNYLYNKFRYLNIPAVGQVFYGVHPPVAITATEDNGELIDFNKYSLINANTILDKADVPALDRFSIISTGAKGSFLGDAILTEKFVDGFNPTGLIASGLPTGAFVPRYGFMVGGSNTVSYQEGVGQIDGATTNSPLVAFGSAAINNDFLAIDGPGVELLGAVNITLSPTAITPDVAVGRICRIAPVSGPTIAYGVILRVTGRVVTFVPYSPRGMKLAPAALTSSVNRFSIPAIPSINVAYHRQALLFATRLMEPPSEDSGARMEVAADPSSGLAVQIFTGGYRVDEFRESRRYATLMGAVLSDYRKACFILSA